MAALQMAAFATWNERRDIIIVNAYKAGFDGASIARQMGLARSTVIRVRDRRKARASRPQKLSRGNVASESASASNRRRNSHQGSRDTTRGNEATS